MDVCHWSVLQDRAPALVRVEALHRPEGLERLRAEVLLPDDSVVADEERLHAGLLVVRRRRDEGEATDHRALDDEVELAERRRRALPLQDLEVVAVVRLVLVPVALRDRAGDLLAHRSAPGAVRVLPGETVLLSRGADDLLRVLVHARAVAALRGVLVLRLDEAPADLDGVELVPADAAEEDLPPACDGVETPRAPGLDDRNRQGPLALACDQRGLLRVLRIGRDDELLASLRGELRRLVPVLDGVLRDHEVDPLGPEDRLERLDVEALRGRDEGLGRRLRRGERPLGRRGRFAACQRSG